MNNSYIEPLETNPDGSKRPISCDLQSFSPLVLCTGPHTHEYIEMLYCNKGSFEIWLNGKHFKFSEGDFAVINSHEIHTISSVSEGSYTVLKFLPEVTYTSQNFALEAKYINPFLINNARHQRVFGKSETDDFNISQKMAEIFTEYTEKKYGYEIAMRNLVGSIFLWVLRYWNSRNDVDLSLYTSVNTELAEKIQNVMDRIAFNLQDDFTAADAAKMCNLSYSYFSRVFKQLTKHSFSEYVTYVRISEAEKLLASTDMSITEIAMKTGFSTSSYFIQQFKAQKKLSPKQFRKNISANL